MRAYVCLRADTCCISMTSVHVQAVLTGNSVGGPQCKDPATVMYNNSYFTPTGAITECGGPMKEKGGSVAALPADSVIIGWAENMLGMK